MFTASCSAQKIACARVLFVWHIPDIPVAIRFSALLAASLAAVMYINTLLPRVPRRLAENRMAWVYWCQIPKHYVRDGMPSKSLCLPGINPAKNANSAFFLGRRLRPCNLFGNLPIVHQSTIFLSGLACAKKAHLQTHPEKRSAMSMKLTANMVLYAIKYFKLNR